MKRDLVYLNHIHDAIRQIEQYTHNGEAIFLSEKHWQDATIRQLEIIGEATKRLSKDLLASNPDVPWRRIAGLRDVLIHEYMGVDIRAVWEITQKNLPQLKSAVENILKKLPAAH